MPYWLRGGIIGGGVTFAFVLLFYSCTLLDTPSNGSFLCLPFLLISPLLPFVDLFDNNAFFHSLPVFSMEITAVVVWFVLGALVGNLVSYIKSKKGNTH